MWLICSEDKIKDPLMKSIPSFSVKSTSDQTSVKKKLKRSKPIQTYSIIMRDLEFGMQKQDSDQSCQLLLLSQLLLLFWMGEEMVSVLWKRSGSYQFLSLLEHWLSLMQSGIELLDITINYIMSNNMPKIIRCWETY